MTEQLFIRLPKLAKVINEKVPGYSAVIEKAFTSTDSKIAGTRMRRDGKGRSGNKLIVSNSDGVVLFEHDASRGGKNDSICYTIENLWGPIWNDDCNKAKPLVCRACKTKESSKNPGHYIYLWFFNKVLCPACNKNHEAGKLKV
jgi:hypothetical protein